MVLAERSVKRVLTPLTGPSAKRSLIASRDELTGRIARVRAGSRSSRLVPSFLIIGAQKAGTTFLYQELVRHPDVVPALTKEIHYFDDRFQRWDRAYPGFFPQGSPEHPDRITGEASPGYLFHPWAVGRIADAIPAVRLVVLLRDPVRRAHSHYRHEVRLGYERLPTFAEALAAEPGRLEGEFERLVADPSYVSFNWRHFSYRARGDYLPQLRRVEERFPREQLLVLRAEDLYADPVGVVKRTASFLGLREDGVASDPGPNDMAAGPAAPLDPAVAEQLAEHFRPSNVALAAHLGVDLGWM